jgi:hypothetical protein
MKTATQNISVSKLVTRFDRELKVILMNDLKAIKAVRDQMMAINANRLSIA